MSGLNSGCFHSDDETDGGTGPGSGDWKLTITIIIQGFETVIEQYVDMESPEEYTYTDDNYSDDDCTVNAGGGVVDVTCQFTGEIPNSNGCTYTADVDGGGTYDETSFEYDYDYVYTCGNGCDFIYCAQVQAMAFTVNIVGEYVGD